MEQVKVMDTNTKNRKFMTIGTIIREQKVTTNQALNSNRV